MHSSVPRTNFYMVFTTGDVILQGKSVGPQLDIPLNSNVNQMEELVNELLQVRASVHLRV